MQCYADREYWRRCVAQCNVACLQVQQGVSQKLRLHMSNVMHG